MRRMVRMVVVMALAAVAVGVLGGSASSRVAASRVAASRVAASRVVASPAPAPGEARQSRAPTLTWARPMPLGRHRSGATLLSQYGATGLLGDMEPAVKISCPTAAQCTVVSGLTVTFNPLTGRILRPLTRVDGDNVLTSVSCPTAEQCTALDAGGDELTFNPRTGRTNRYGLRQVGGGDNAMSAVACSSAEQCTAVDHTGEQITFDPRTGRMRSAGIVAVRFDPGLFRYPNNPLLGVACPSVAQCTAVGSEYNAGAVVTTFDPRTGHVNPAGVTYLPEPHDPSSPYTPVLDSVACPSVSQCTATDLDGTVITFNPILGPGSTPFTALSPSRLYAIDCPSTRDCTAVNHLGDAIAFDPARPAAAHRVRAAHRSGLLAVACPSRMECAAVTGAGYVAIGRVPARRRR